MKRFAIPISLLLALGCGATAAPAASSPPCRRGTTVSRGVRSAPGMEPPTRLILENASDDAFCRVELVAAGASPQTLYEGSRPGFDPGSILPVDATPGAYTLRWTSCDAAQTRELPVEVHPGEETTVIVRAEVP